MPTPPREAAGALLVLVLVSAFAMASIDVSGASAQPARAQVILRVEGMHCGACASRLQDILARLDGVLSARVSFDETRATVTYDARRVSTARIVSAIEDAGFRARFER